MTHLCKHCGGDPVRVKGKTLIHYMCENCLIMASGATEAAAERAWNSRYGERECEYRHYQWDEYTPFGDRD